MSLGSPGFFLETPATQTTQKIQRTKCESEKTLCHDAKFHDGSTPTSNEVLLFTSKLFLVPYNKIVWCSIMLAIGIKRVCSLFDNYNNIVNIGVKH